MGKSLAELLLFVDVAKHTSFAATYVFLAINGLDIIAMYGEA